ncbi:amino acid adenylation domain-containing protein [Mumia flava]|uniref:Amino acid adenylation domain-containing protein n=1 Tax=Mumia flava TaxID=1348852 RepID=A0A0B2AYC7_9ACTN|nr:non-ribosomal peptide synthetase [Mumia flava]PJJ54106.1 amino acid adenylation domain-containing protein [Mumia flava]
MTASDIEDVYELSPLQQGMLLHSLYGGDSDTYLAQHSFAVDGPLDAQALETAWQHTVAEHPALRTSFHWDGLDTPLQVVHGDVHVDLRRHDWSALDERDQDERTQQVLADERAAGFDLARAPLLRLDLARLGVDRHLVVWTHHMLPVDGWSVPLVIGEVVGRYLSITTGSPAPPPAPHYRDYIAWLQQQDLGAARQYWIETLGDTAGFTGLGLLRPAVSEDAPAVIDEQGLALGDELGAALRATAARHRVTQGTLMLAAWALVMERFTGEPDVRFGVACSGRPAALPHVDRMVGSFVNSLPLQVTVPADRDVGEWLREVQAQHAAARRYEFSPLSQIKAWTGVAATERLFDSLLVLENYPVDLGDAADANTLSVRGLTDFEKTSEPLTVFVTAGSGLRVLYHRDRILDSDVEQIVEAFRNALTTLTRVPRTGGAALSLAPARRPDPAARGAFVRWGDAGACLPALVQRWVDRTPDAPAVVADDGVLGFAELWDRASAVAAGLGEAGVRRGATVGVCAERGVDLVVALLGTQLAGAAYLPLEPSLPEQRLSFMAADAGAEVVIAQPGTAALARSTGVGTIVDVRDVRAAPSTWTPPPGHGSDLAYVIYTSGSTGRPKGVAITHDAIANRLLWMQDTFGLTQDDRVLQKTPFGFDVSVWEVFWPLITGAVVVMARPGGHQDAAYLAEIMRDGRVTTAHFVPSMLELFVDEPGSASLPALRRVLCSGEALPHGLAERFTRRLPQVALHNLYGPTEAAVDVTWWDCGETAPPGVIPIGRPVANTRAHVLDRRLVESPRSVPGELYLGGVQLATGYVGRPGLTASTFVAHPLAGPGGRLYRTGDKVLRLADGSLEFLGRVDHQVKINGYRIEPGEIEQTLLRHHAVREGVVVVRSRGEHRELAAYVTAGDDVHDQPGLSAQLRAHLAERLPRYMVPATVTVLGAMPLTHNGKLDRAALPDPRPVVRVGEDRSPAGPVTPGEKAVAAAFEEVLGVSALDRESDFFALGGTSFDAVRAIRRIDGATVPLITEHPTVRALAAALETPADASMLLSLARPGTQPATSLVCVPFGGGSAIAYRALAGELSPDVGLHAVTLPGHEPGSETALHPVTDVAGECAASVLALPPGPVAVYGHCAGVALAVEVVRQVEAAGRPVERLFLGASYPFYAPRRTGRAVQRVLAGLVQSGWLRVGARTVGTTRIGVGEADRAEVRYLRAIGGFGTEVDDETIAFVMRAFRHDVVEGGRYFADVWTRGIEPWLREPSEPPAPLSAPITFIAGTADPLTVGYGRGVRQWDRFGSSVDLAVIPEGRHYFLQDQPEVLASVIERSLDAHCGRCGATARAS